MLKAALVVIALLAAPHPLAAGLLALALYLPHLFLATAAVWAGFHQHRRSVERRRLPAMEADFLHGVAAEIEAGASVREAVVAGSERTPALQLDTVARLARAGRPAVEVARRLAAALPCNGRLVGAAYELVAATGARAAVVFTSLAVRASDAGDLERERRALSAQARLSAWIVGGLPAGVTVGLLVFGRGPRLSGVEGAIAVVGLFLVATGGAIVWLMVRHP